MLTLDEPVPCTDCGTDTTNRCRYCDACIDEATRASCAEQGVPVFPTDPTALRELSRAFSTVRPPIEEVA